MNDRNEFLEKIELFGGLDGDSIEIVSEHLKEETFSKGEVLIKEGETGNKLYVLVSGSAVVSKELPENAGSIQVNEIGPGDAFGEMELLDTMPRSATITASSDCEALSLATMDLYKVYNISSSTYRMLINNVARSLSRRLRSVEQRLLETIVQARAKGSTSAEAPLQTDSKRHYF